ncbi:UNVERIFIED_CONTAM: ARF guanine-nucleotide exchange factor GNL2 [Sesamum radiatum]|uniref:ARF guanine-nucleotide exchange factor GNL2 n=1 Tax=Sesamum radiatum TaxID=300843 RepID=A0AAW2PGW7_SESRA
MIQDDLFHHLIHYGASASPLVLSMISSTVLNIYHFLRRSIRLQLEAFFSFVLFKVATPGSPLQLQEVAVEAIINFCRQPTFILELYVNYDSDPTFRNVFEETGKLLCKYAFPTGGISTSIQVQAFEGLSIIFHYIADNIDKEDDSSPSGPYPVEIPGTPNPKAYAYFFRYTPKLDKTVIGNYLGDPDAFHLQVLKEFTETFEFAGMVLDTALRTYLETFRLPGESQKIQRVLEAFSDNFTTSNPRIFLQARMQS